jgi:hypothetical protein
MRKKHMTVLGALLTLTMLIGTSVPVQAQTWHYGQSIYYGYWGTQNCHNATNALSGPNTLFATAGTNGPPPALGKCVIDLGSGNEMGPNQNFTVFATSVVNETYWVTVWVDNTSRHSTGWYGYDVKNYEFFTPPTSGKLWRFIEIVGITGSISGSDPIYGPEIDAVGWYG